MNPGAKKALHVVTTIWIVVGMVCYCYAFTRDFYASNKLRVDTILTRVGL